jgi:hypothetical protein
MIIAIVTYLMLHFGGGGALSFDVYAAGGKDVLQDKHQIEAIKSITSAHPRIQKEHDGFPIHK